MLAYTTAKWIIFFVISLLLFLLLLVINTSKYMPNYEVSQPPFIKRKNTDVELTDDNNDTQSRRINQENFSDMEQKFRICSQNERKHQIKAMCKLYNYPRSDQTKNRFVVDDQNKVAYGVLQKAGCTSIKFIMANISSNGRVPSDLKGPLIHQHGILKKFGLKLLILTPRQVERDLRGYTKFTVVRNPFDRLVSAYVDKIGKIGKMKILSHEIVKRYRVHDKNMKNLRYATFEEFLQFLLDPVLSLKGNEHWDAYFNRINPCNIDYDYILKVETFEHDLPILLSSAYNDIDLRLYKNTNKNSNRNTNTNAKTAKYLKEYHDIGEELLNKILVRHNLEAKYLCYRFNVTTSTAICGCSIDNISCC